MGRKERKISATYFYFLVYQAVEKNLHTLEDLGDKSVASRTEEVGLARGFI